MKRWSCAMFVKPAVRVNALDHLEGFCGAGTGTMVQRIRNQRNSKWQNFIAWDECSSQQMSVDLNRRSMRNAVKQSDL
jgi:hypothetical protein